MWRRLRHKFKLHLSYRAIQYQETITAHFLGRVKDKKQTNKEGSGKGRKKVSETETDKKQQNKKVLERGNKKALGNRKT